MDDVKVYVPPIKIQGIKTKLVQTIKANVAITSDSLWVEPFMGSGVVGFNIAPRKAIFADTNPYIIDFYENIKTGKITSLLVRRFLENEGKKLSAGDDEYYYTVRDRFNEQHNPLDFLFLNRSCFNGMIRFNREGKFNVPYGHKRERFSKAYITKIVNQVAHVEMLIKENDWIFLCQSFEKTLAQIDANSFVYCDPPYIGRHVDYFDSWTEADENVLKDLLFRSKAQFMLSTWNCNEFRSNKYLSTLWSECQKIDIKHFYHVGAKETNRNAMTESLLTNYQITGNKNLVVPKKQQFELEFA